LSILSDFEDRVSRAVEGVFAGVFRSPVQPAELARACAKEMDRRRKLGVGKVYAPTMYSVLLSPEDAGQIGGFSETLAGELETYLVGYARERSYDLAARPVVRFLVDEELRLGRFEVIGELLSPEEIATEMADVEGYAEVSEPVPARASTLGPENFSATTALPTIDDETWAASMPLSAGATLATVTIPGVAHDVALTGDRVVMGRLRACDVVLEDVNASRQHAALEREGAGWVLVDLGSTNGTLVNGERVDRVRLLDGDVITVGITEVTFHEPRG
jgi:hypothetical protein